MCKVNRNIAIIIKTGLYSWVPNCRAYIIHHCMVTMEMRWQPCKVHGHAYFVSVAAKDATWVACNNEKHLVGQKQHSKYHHIDLKHKILQSFQSFSPDCTMHCSVHSHDNSIGTLARHVNSMMQSCMRLRRSNIPWLIAICNVQLKLKLWNDCIHTIQLDWKWSDSFFNIPMEMGSCWTRMATVPNTFALYY